MKQNLLITILALGLCAASCKKTPAPAPEPLPPSATGNDTSGSLTIVLNHVVNDSLLVLQSKQYTNANGDTFNVNIFKYYFTNIVLKTASGYTFTQPESYYLVDASDPNSMTLQVHGVPRANYTSISFLIGVDKARNTSGAQTGALDPGNGMFWTWNSGYIMAKFEGTSPQSGDPAKKLTFHLGGFTSTNNVIRSVNFNFPNSANVTETHTPTLHIQGDVAEWFKTPNLVSFATTYAITVSNANAKNMADNYADMFSLTSVSN